MSAPNSPRIGSGRDPCRTGEFVALDFELTGLDPARDAIVSFGTAPVSGGRVQLGRTEKHTLSRIEIASAAGLITEEEGEGLQEAFRLLWQIRLEHQARCARDGIDPDDYEEVRIQS